MSLPLLLVADGESTRRLARALWCSHVLYRACDEEEALRELRGKQAELVVLQPTVPRAFEVASLAREVGAETVAWLPDAAAGAAAEELLALPAARSEPELLSRIQTAEAALFRGRQRASLDVRRARVAEAVNRFARSVATRLELPELVRDTVARVRELLGADGASLLLVDPHTGELCFETVDGAADGKLRQLRLRPGQGIAGQVALFASPKRVRSAAEDPAFDSRADQASGFKTGSVIAVPLLAQGDVLGVLQAVRQVARRPFDPDELELLELLSPHVTTAVHNAQVTAELRRMQQRQHRLNEELEQKVVERSAQIARAKQEWEATIDAISEPIALLEDLVVRRANQAWARHAGVPIRDVVGKKCHELFAKRSTPCPGCPLATAVPTNAALRTELPLGDDLFAFTAFWLSDDPDERRVVVTYQDISARRQLEGKLRESERLASIGQLASGAAHEINNPLGFVVSNLGTLQGVMEELREQGHPAELVEEATAMIVDSLDGARRVQEIVRSLRQLSKLEVGGGENASVNESAQRAINAEAASARPHVQLELRATRPAAIAPLHLDQALGQIVKNARQAVAPKAPIFVRTFDEESRVVVEIEDRGCGIAPEHLPRIFDPFFTTRAVGQGVGLGLTAAYGIVRRAGGAIDVRSEPGRGSTFRVSLPTVVAQAESPEHDIGLEIAVALAHEATSG